MGYSEVLKDFNKLPLSNIETKSNGTIVGVLPNSSLANVRPEQPVRVQLAMNIVTADEKVGAANTTSKTSAETVAKNKPKDIAQYQWFSPASALTKERKPQPTNKEPEFILGKDENY